MKALLAKLPMQKAIGLYLGDQEMAICQVASTPLGLVETARGRESCLPQEREAVLARLLRPLVGPGQHSRVPIAVGLPAARFFFATRPLRAVGDDAPPEVLLQKALQSPTICVDEFNVDVIKSQWNKVPIASVAACRRKQLSEVLAMLEHCGVRPFRVEPDSSALVRTAAQRHRLPRRAKTVLHVFLSDVQGLAVLAAATLPVACEVCPARREGGSRNLLRRAHAAGPGETLRDRSAAGRGRNLRPRRPPCPPCRGGRRRDGQRPAPPGRSGPERRRDCAGLGPGLPQSEPAGLRPLALAQAPGVDPRDFSMGRAGDGSGADDLPGLVTYRAGLGAGPGVRSGAGGKGPARLPGFNRAEKLEKEKSELRDKVEAVRRFLATRVLWTAYTHDLPVRLPPRAQLVSLQGLCELESFAKKEGAIKPKKSLVLRAMAPLGGGGSMPHEIDGFLNALRNHPLLKNEFPEVVLADIKRFQVLSGSQPMAIFSVVCLPGPKGAAAQAAGGEAGKKVAP